MWKAIAGFLFKIFRWEIIGTKPRSKKFIVIVMPHTSWYDFVMGKCYGVYFGIKSKALIKKEAFFFPLNLVIKAFGGIPVDRSANRHLAAQMVEYFNFNEEFGLTLTPEGTRNKVNRLKRGFYYIAQATGTPVFMGFIDYRTRKLGIGPEFLITGDFDKDLIQIKEFYKGMEGLHRGRFDATILT
jgi:1-acyl-sn-glycerol-3-phosphate acyltransferase